MKIIRLVGPYFAIVMAVATLGLGYANAGATSDTTLSNTTLQSIQQNCVPLQGTLQQLTYSDTALRVNQGQYYEEISTKLMATMNSRISLNNYDGGNLISIAADYAKQIDEFRTRYTTYANALTATRNDDCSKDPQGFYDDLVTARNDRQDLRKVVIKLNALVNSYEDTFTTFSKSLSSQSNGGQG